MSPPGSMHSENNKGPRELPGATPKQMSWFYTVNVWRRKGQVPYKCTKTLVIRHDSGLNNVEWFASLWNTLDDPLYNGDSCATFATMTYVTFWIRMSLAWRWSILYQIERQMTTRYLFFILSDKCSQNISINPWWLQCQSLIPQFCNDFRYHAGQTKNSKYTINTFFFSFLFFFNKKGFLSFHISVISHDIMMTINFLFYRF